MNFTSCRSSVITDIFPHRFHIYDIDPQFHEVGEKVIMFCHCFHFSSQNTRTDDFLLEKAFDVKVDIS